jgi:hypothetical protein
MPSSQQQHYYYYYYYYYCLSSKKREERQTVHQYDGSKLPKLALAPKEIII